MLHFAFAVNDTDLSVKQYKVIIVLEEMKFK